MNLRPLDVIQVTEQHESGWWEGARMLDFGGQAARVTTRQSCGTAPQNLTQHAMHRGCSDVASPTPGLRVEG